MTITPRQTERSATLNVSTKPGTGIWQVVKSVAASAFGVQSEKNRIQDFEQSQSIVPYAVVGVVFVILFIVGIMLVVNLAIS